MSYGQPENFGAPGRPPLKVLAKRSVNSPSLYTRAEASPQVKAALAARRRDQKAKQKEDNEWGLTSEHEAIEQAKKTGKLNLSARELDDVPHAAFTDLVPRESRFHPNRHGQVNVELDLDQVDVGQRTMWYEQVELRHFVAPNNLFTRISEHIGGLGDLETLELQGNRLERLPDTLVMLTMLTVVNLASNAIADFPTPLLSLKALRELDLSGNALSRLWPVTWQEEASQLELTVKTTSPSATPESASNSSTTLFWGRPASPLSRVKPPDSPTFTIEANDDSNEPRAPWPRLRTLRLAGNKLRELPQAWPKSLSTLDLSGNGLRQIDVLPLARLQKLETLNLASNALLDDDFVVTESPEDGFKALKRLDLSLNGFETLGALESFFDRAISYEGLPKLLVNLVAADQQNRYGSSAELDGVRIRIAGNTLVNERDRRRKRFGGGHDDAPTQYEVPGATCAEAKAKEDEDVLAEERASQEQQAPTPTMVERIEADSHEEMNEAAHMALEHLDGTRVNLDKLELTSMPTTSSVPAVLANVTELSLTGNPLKTFSFDCLGPSGWQWHDTLTSLSLTNCKLTGIESHITLALLKTLDLSVNQLSEECLSLCASFPALQTLDLSRNRLATLNGIDALLTACPKLQRISFSANRIGDIDALAEAARKQLVHASLSRIDLSDNEIARLPVDLGHLPFGVSLLVTGNTFRVPKEDVYASAGDKLISWLKDRL